jgi:DNA primase
MRFSPDFIQQLRDRVSLSSLVGRYVRLQKKGREWAACCPFHAEKSPSFSVNDEKQFYHCFGCGAHGDAVGFVMQIEGLSFPEACEKVAVFAGVALPVESSAPQTPSHTQDYALLAETAAWFAAQLHTPQGMRARDYLRSRGLTEKTIAAFGLGYAPDSRTALKNHLQSKGFSNEAMIRQGVLIRPDQGEPYDRFRSRLMFPITDGRERVIAFGGRILGDGQPKYLNSPETPLFHKGGQLYHAAAARKAAHTSGRLVLVEGYMDVIALAQAGIEEAVAPLGTAFTESQLEQCWAMTPEPILCLDGDSAGQRAMRRAAEMALPKLKAGFSLRFATLPAGEDPDSLLRQQGQHALSRMLEKAQPLNDWLWQALLQDFGEGTAAFTPERKAAAEKQWQAWVEKITDPAVRGHYRDLLYARRQQLRKNFTPKGSKKPLAPLSNTPLKANGQALWHQEKLFMALILTHPALLEQEEESFAALTFTQSEYQQLQSAVLGCWHQLTEPTTDALLTLLGEHQTLAKSILASNIIAFPAQEAGQQWRSFMQQCMESPVQLTSSSEADWEQFVAARMGQETA